MSSHPLQHGPNQQVFISPKSSKPLPGTLESSGKWKKCQQTYSRGRVGSSNGSLTTTHLCWWRTAGCLASWRGTGACFWPPTWSRWAHWWTCCQDQLSENGLTESWASLRRNECCGEREDKEEEEGEEKDAAQMLGASGGLLQSACVHACVRTCVCTRATCLWAGISTLAWN